MSIGSRLKEERERLGFTQPAFAALANTTKKSQIDYEKDVTQPKAGYLSVIANVGADVQYIVTGLHSQQALAQEESLLLVRYRQADVQTRNKLLMLLLADAEVTSSNVANTINNTGKGDQFNAKKQVINKGQVQNNNFNGGFAGDYVNRDKHGK